MKYQSLSGALLVLILALRSTNAITCQSCTSSINEQNVETGDANCAAGTNTKTEDSKDAGRNVEYVCSTTVIDSGASITVNRKVESNEFEMKWVNNTKNYCTSGGYSTICYCNWDNCNKNAVAERSYECYECQSSDYFDNGCGAELDSTSRYVYKVKGCTACTKTLSIDLSDMSTSYVRGCSREFDEYEGCIRDEKLFGSRHCACKGDNCNSAVALKSTSVFVAALFLSIVRLLL